MAGAVGAAFAAPYLAKVPGFTHPVGRIAISVGIAWLGVSMLDGAAEAIVVGIGAGLLAQALVGLATGA